MTLDERVAGTKRIENNYPRGTLTTSVTQNTFKKQMHSSKVTSIDFKNKKLTVLSKESKSSIK